MRTGQTIKILGAGISGLVAANLLAEAGISVQVFEKRGCVGAHHGKRSIAMLRQNPYPGYDGIAELQKLGIPYRLDNRVGTEVRISHRYQVTLPERTILFSVVRGQDEESLESFLLQRALEKGVQLFYNATLSPSEVDIVASGCAHPNVRGYGETLEDVSVDINTVYTVYDNGCVPNGYFCVMPSSRGDATFLAVSFDPGLSAENLKAIFDRALREHPIIRELARGGKVISSSRGGGFYAQDPYALCLTDGRIHVGEAAGFLEAGRGFGLRYAMITGALAARAIISGDSYQKMVQDYFGDEFQRNWRRRKELESLTDAQYDQIVKEMGGQLI